jgi:hypothetical protein
MPDSTILRLVGMGIPPYSARGIQESLSPIGESIQLRRTINGALDDVSDPLFRKYQVSWSATDMDPPAIEGVWSGLQLVVDCITELAVLGTFEADSEGGSEPGFDRMVVPGSVRHADGFTFYRPRLTMRVTGFSIDRGEWEASVAWQLSAEEV